MKKIQIALIALAIIFSLNSCKIQAPEFRRVDNTRYDTGLKSGITVGADVVFYNPNRGRFKIQAYNLEIFADGKKMATLNENCNIAVKPKNEFTVPVKAVIKPETNVLDGLKTLFKAVTNKEIDLRINGKVEFKWLLSKKTINIDVNKKVKIQ